MLCAKQPMETHSGPTPDKCLIEIKDNSILEDFMAGFYM